MSYIRRGDIMIHSLDLSQLPTNSRSGSNINQCYSMESSISESSEHYATLGRTQRNTTGSCSNPDRHRCNINTVPYTRYIRPCTNLQDVNGNNSILKPTAENDSNSNPIQLSTWKKRRGDRSRVRKRKIVFSFVCGLVFGFIIFSIVWLTVDRLKENKIICEFSDKSKGEININDRKNISTSTQKTQTTTRSQDSVADGPTKSTVSGISSPLTTKLIETSNPTLSESTVLTTSQLSSRLQSFTPPVTKKTTTTTKSSTLFSSTRKDTTSSSETPTTTEDRSAERQTLSEISTEPTSNAQDDSVSSTTQISPKTSLINVNTSSSFLTTTTPNSVTAKTSSPLPSDLTSASVSSSASTTAASAEDFPENVDKRSIQGGHVYVRWGSLSCPLQSEQLYKGYAAGGHYQHQGGATNTICLPEVPTWGNYSNNADSDRALVYGTEYGSTDSSFTATTGEKLRNKDVPCSVCQATGRLSHIMMPGKAECFPGWTQEYKGYLMGSGYIQNHASELICVDSRPDHVAGSSTFKGGNLLYLAEVRTGTLPSPPYVNGRELACVVCTS